MTGRARGRARGRSRASDNSEPLRRPGQQASNSTGQGPGGQSGSNSVGVHASAPQQDPGGLASQLQQISLGNRDSASQERGDILYQREGNNGAEPQGAESLPSQREPPRNQQSNLTQYQTPRFRREDLTDKRGDANLEVVPLVSNFFQLRTSIDWIIWQYWVDFNPRVASDRIRKALLYSNHNVIGGTHAFDGQILYLPRKLPDKETVVFGVQNTDGVKIRITITRTNELPPNSPMALQLINILLRKATEKTNAQLIGRNYYNHSKAIDIPQYRVTLLPGYETSVLSYERNVFLCVELSFKILRTDTVYDEMRNIYDEARRQRVNFQDRCERELLGTIVLTRYNNRTYRVDGIAWDVNPLSTFKRQDGSSISYVDYYMQAYGKEIDDRQQPLLVSRSKKKDVRMGRPELIYLIPEFCLPTGLHPAMKSDFMVMREIAKHTRKDAVERCKILSGFVDEINRKPEARMELDRWGVSFTNQPQQMNGRWLTKENIVMGPAKNQVVSFLRKDAEWSNGMREMLMCCSVPLTNWIIVYTRRNEANAGELVVTLQTVGPVMGMDIRSPYRVVLNDDSNSSYTEALKKYIDSEIQMVMCILPRDKKDQYDTIKKICCIQHPVPSQCVLNKTINKKDRLMSVATKVAVQLNCKLGGEPWAIPIPTKEAMFIGIDVYHDTMKKGRSVGGIVFSLNPSVTRWYSKCAFHHTAQELMDNVIGNLRCALNEYIKVNGRLPGRVHVYRDGVGDGMLEAVYKHEIKQMLDCFRLVGGENYNPKLCFTVVKKRINARFFARNYSGLQNPPPGTVVDDVVTKSEWQDFFLVSQSVKQGTVTPTHYNVIWNESGLQPKNIQSITYKLTHLYYNWPGTIRVPAPCQYAHKLAYLVGNHLHIQPSDDLANRLFYL